MMPSPSIAHDPTQLISQRSRWPRCVSDACSSPVSISISSAVLQSDTRSIDPRFAARTCACTSLSILTRDHTPGFSALRPSPEAQITSQHLLLESDDIRPTPHQNIQVWTLPLSCARPISPTMAGHKPRPRGSNSACSGVQFELGYGETRDVQLAQPIARCV